MWRGDGRALTAAASALWALAAAQKLRGASVGVKLGRCAEVSG